MYTPFSSRSGDVTKMSMDIIKTGWLDVKTHKSKYHTIESHDYWINRNGTCPYCKNDSIPVHKSLLNKDGEWRVKAIKEIK